MRRLVALLSLVLALAVASSAAAAFQPIRRTHGELELPRVRAGTIEIPDAHRQGRVTVLITLAQPPLAAWSRSLAGRSSTRRLNVSSRSSRAYVATLVAAQKRAEAALRRAIPTATVTRSYTLLLNGMAVELPAKKLPAAAKLSFAHKLYPEPPLHPRAEPRPGRDRRGSARRGGRRERRRDQDRRRRRRRRPEEHLLRPVRLHVPRGLPEGRHEVDDAQGDRRPIVRRSGSGRRQPACARREIVVPRDARGRDRGRQRGHDRPGEPRPSRGHRPFRRRSARPDRQLPRLQRPDLRGSRRQHAGDRRRVRVGRPRRDGRDQLLGRRPPDRSGERCADRGRAQRRRGGRRAGDLGRQRPRRLRPRLDGIAGNGAGRDLRRRALQHARVRPGPLRRRSRRAREHEGDPIRGARPSGVGHDRPAARRRRLDRLRRRNADAPQPLRAARQPERRRLTASRGLPDRDDRAGLARRLRLRAQGRARQGRGRDRNRPRRQPPGRGERDSGRAGRAGGDDLRPRRRPASRLSRALMAGERRFGSAAIPRSSPPVAAASSRASRPVG